MQADVGRIRDHHVETLQRECLEKIAGDELDARSEVTRVSGGHGKRGRRDVDAQTSALLSRASVTAMAPEPQPTSTTLIPGAMRSSAAADNDARFQGAESRRQA